MGGKRKPPSGDANASPLTQEQADQATRLAGNIFDLIVELERLVGPEAVAGFLNEATARLRAAAAAAAKPSHAEEAAVPKRRGRPKGELSPERGRARLELLYGAVAHPDRSANSLGERIYGASNNKSLLHSSTAAGKQLERIRKGGAHGNPRDILRAELERQGMRLAKERGEPPEAVLHSTEFIEGVERILKMLFPHR